jgi:hypothetical protein
MSSGVLDALDAALGDAVDDWPSSKPLRAAP